MSIIRFEVVTEYSVKRGGGRLSLSPHKLLALTKSEGPIINLIISRVPEEKQKKCTKADQSFEYYFIHKCLTDCVYTSCEIFVCFTVLSKNLESNYGYSLKYEFLNFGHRL